jgi:hypothetical protein
MDQREGRWACKTYEQLFDLLEFLQKNVGKNRKVCLAYFDKDEYAECTVQDKRDMIDLVVLLWLRVDVTKQRHPGQGPCNKQVWDDEASLETIIQRQFPKCPVADYTTRKPNWTRYLRAWSLTKCQYFRVRWTNRLEDHLFLDPYQEPPELWIFHWATFLEEFSSPQNPDFQLFPTGLLQETKDTLALLLPFLDSHSTSWFNKETNSSTDVGGESSKQPNILGSNGSSGRRLLDRFWFKRRNGTLSGDQGTS